MLAIKNENIPRTTYFKGALAIILFTFLAFGCESRGNTERLLKEDSLKTGLEQYDSSNHNRYSWLSSYDFKEKLVNRIPVPAGYERIPVVKNSFADWLRNIPLMKGNPKVMLYDGTLKYNQSAQYAVVNIDRGKEDLQQCADAVMRLKAEYHYSRKDYEAIHFKFTNGDLASYLKWKEGYRPVVKGNKVTWAKTAEASTSYKSFKSYLRQVFMYAGTSSLSKEMLPIDINEMRPGYVFIKGGFPGHAVLVMDMAIHKSSKEKLFILAQSYMPAQDIHLLINPSNPNSPWYSLNFEGSLHTPEWTFERTDLKRFR